MRGWRAFDIGTQLASRIVSPDFSKLRHSPRRVLQMKPLAVLVCRVVYELRPTVRGLIREQRHCIAFGACHAFAGPVEPLCQSP
jgi:hypothetical protein